MKAAPTLPITFYGVIFVAGRKWSLVQQQKKTVFGLRMSLPCFPALRILCLKRLDQIGANVRQVTGKLNAVEVPANLGGMQLGRSYSTRPKRPVFCSGLGREGCMTEIGPNADPSGTNPFVNVPWRAVLPF